MRGNFLEIWHGNILSEESEIQTFYSLLNEEEKTKAATFIRLEIQKKYINTRGVLRKVLGSYLDIKPREIIIRTGEHGKPFVDNEGELFFNLSHTGNKFAIAVSNCGDVGIDLEQYRDRSNLQGLVEKCFSDHEQHYWQDLSKQQKVIMFYRFWVRKEAFVKAVGRGIALGLDQCNVNPQNQSQFLSIPDGHGLAEDWKIVDVTLEQDDVCAVVIKDMEFTYKQIELK